MTSVLRVRRGGQSALLRAVRTQTAVHPRRAFSATRCRLERFENATVEDFKTRVMSQTNKPPILVDFFADWCGPCKMLSPLLEELVSDTKHTSGQELDLMTLDTDEQANAPLAMKYKITALPTVIMFKDGEAVGRFTGFMPMAAVSQWCQTVLQDLREKEQDAEDPDAV